MNTPNANKVCQLFWSYTTDCKNCPIKAECQSSPKDSSHPADWEERIEQAATAYLQKKEAENG